MAFLFILAAGSLKATRAEELDGVLEVLVEDYADHAVTHHRLITASGEKLELKFPPGRVPDNLTSGHRVRARGRRSNATFVLAADGTQSFSVIEAASTTGTAIGTFTAVVLLTNFANDTRQPLTPAQVQTAYTTVTDFYRQASFGQTTMAAANVVGWLTLPINATCDINTLESAAKQAATNAGVNWASYNRTVMFFPSQSCGGWVGMAYVGGQFAWINGQFNQRVVSHELGHNFSLQHANSLDCGSVAYTTTGTCTAAEYGAPYDIMGAYLFDFNSSFKQILGYSAVQPVTATGDYDLKATELPTTLPQGLRLTSQNTNFYVEYRHNVGLDTSITNANVLNGVLVYKNQNPVYALDMTPETSAFSDGGLAIGKSYTDPGGVFKITPLSNTSDTLRVHVDLFSDTVAPTISFTTPSAGATVSQWVNVTLSASDNVRVVKIELSVDNVLQSTLTATPYTWYWDSQTVPNGSHTISAKATDAANNVGAANLTVQVLNTDTIGPTVALVAPPAGATVSGDVLLQANAYDNVAVDRVEFWVDSKLFATDSTSPYNAAWSTYLWSDGTHNISARAYDSSGAMASDAVSVQVANGPTHPADVGKDFDMSLDDVLGYAACWKSGCTWARGPNPIPIDFLTVAATLWKTGQTYHQQTGSCPQCWVTGP